jgi:hypothetical protein
MILINFLTRLIQKKISLKMKINNYYTGTQAKIDYKLFRK